MGNKEAFVFPGQGSQKKGMGSNLLHHPDSQLAGIARNTFEQADDELKINFTEICLTDPLGQLDRTAYTQPALLIVSTAASRMLAAQDRRPDVVAGHSLGEYSALVCAGAFSFVRALHLVRARGAFMDRSHPGRMAAILNLSPDEVGDICACAGAEIAGFNSLDQTVISGRIDAVQRASALAGERNGHAVELNVSIASHSSLMDPVRKSLDDLLEKTPIASPQIPFIANVSGGYVQSPGMIRSGLIDQVTRPVRWLDTMETMRESGVTSVVEVGPGRALSGFFKKTIPTMQLSSTDKIFPTS